MFEGIGVIAAIIIFLIIFGEKSSNNGANTYDRKSLGINPNDDGSFTVYDKQSQTDLFTGTIAECEQWIEENAE